MSFFMNNLKESEKIFNDDIKIGFSTNENYLSDNLSWAINKILNNVRYTQETKHDLLKLLHGWHIKQVNEKMKSRMIETIQRI